MQCKVIKEPNQLPLRKQLFGHGEFSTPPRPSARATCCPRSCYIVRPSSCHVSNCVHSSSRSNGLGRCLPGEFALERLLIRNHSPRLRKLWSCTPALQCIFGQVYDPDLWWPDLISRVRSDQRSPTITPLWAFLRTAPRLR